jgi:hypothetical protein
MLCRLLLWWLVGRMGENSWGYWWIPSPQVRSCVCVVWSGWWLIAGLLREMSWSYWWISTPPVQLHVGAGLCVCCVGQNKWKMPREGSDRGFTHDPLCWPMLVYSSIVRMLCHVGSVHVSCTKPLKEMSVVPNVANV